MKLRLPSNCVLAEIPHPKRRKKFITTELTFERCTNIGTWSINAKLNGSEYAEPPYFCIQIVQQNPNPKPHIRIFASLLDPLQAGSDEAGQIWGDLDDIVCQWKTCALPEILPGLSKMCQLMGQNSRFLKRAVHLGLKGHSLPDDISRLIGSYLPRAFLPYSLFALKLFRLLSNCKSPTATYCELCRLIKEDLGGPTSLFDVDVGGVLEGLDLDSFHAACSELIIPTSTKRLI